jgi:hypothetical protein
MKTKAGRSRRSEDDISLGASQEEAACRQPMPSTDAASSSVVSQRRSGVLSQRNQFTRKYETQ